MNELQQRLTEDLSIARSLAEEGRNAPLVGGIFYVVWGLAIFACLIFNWAVVSGALAATPWSIPAVWFAVMGAAHVYSRLAGQRLRALPGAGAISNAVSGAVWRSVGLFLGLFAVTLFAALFQAPTSIFGGAAADGRQFGAAFSIFLPVSFGAYGVALAATAEAAKSPLLKRFSLLSFIVMTAALALIGRPAQFIVGAAGILLVSVLPGAIMMRRAAAPRNG